MMAIGSDSTFNDGLLGCTAGYATGSAPQVALTGYGSLYWNIIVSDIKASVKRLN
jgi:hypothetical protein